MKLLILLLVIMASLPAQANVISYKVWKAQKVHQAQHSISKLHLEMRSSHSAPAVAMRMKQAKTNLSIARELTPNDYFVLYLGPKYQGNAKAIEVAARFMSRQELAQILMGYSNRLHEREEFPTPSFPPELSQASQSISK